MQASLGETLTIVLGISSGILTLVGLIAVFVSINSQHNIQKCRELYWDIRSSSIYDDLSEPKNLKAILEKLWLYGDLLNGGDRITDGTVRLAKITILVVVAIWLTVLFYIKNNVNFIDFAYSLGITTLGILVMISFNHLLSTLKKYNKLSGLPTYDELLDANKHHINTVAIAAHTVEYEFIDSTKHLIHFPLRFKNLHFYIEPYYLDKDENKIGELSESFWSYRDGETEVIELNFENKVFANGHFVQSFDISSEINYMIENGNHKVDNLKCIIFTMCFSMTDDDFGVDVDFKIEVPFDSGLLKPVSFKDRSSAKWVIQPPISERNPFSMKRLLNKKKVNRVKQHLPSKFYSLPDFSLDNILNMNIDEIKALNYMTPDLLSEILDILDKEGIELKRKRELFAFIRPTLKSIIEKVIEKIKSNIEKRKLKREIRTNGPTDIKIEKINFTLKTYNQLKKAQLRTLDDLIHLKKNEVAEKNLTEKHIHEVIIKLKELGIDISED